jgi:hypothetical protein
MMDANGTGAIKSTNNIKFQKLINLVLSKIIKFFHFLN